MCASPDLWSECLVALVRRSVVAWGRLDDFPELRSVVAEVELDWGGEMFMVAMTATSADGSPPSLAERSRLAVFRITDWFNGHGDLVMAMGAAVSVARLLVSASATLEEDVLIEEFVHRLSSEADDLLRDH